MIKAQHITKSVPSYEGTLHILQDISLQIAAAESVAVVGESGSGKSTLLSLLAGLDVPTTGTIELDGTDITPLSEDERALVRSRLVGFVFQAFQLLPSLTALENVMLPAELKQLSNAKQLATRYLERVGLGARMRHYPRQLSGGEQQRVAIARAFASDAPILFADEPTGNLDTKTGARIIDLLFELNQDADRTLVLVTHEERLAKRCHRVLQLEAGRLVIG